MAGGRFKGSVATSVVAMVFPSLGVSMTEREIQSVTDYVIVVLRGKVEPTREECLAFLGRGFRTGVQVLPVGATS